MAAFGLASNAAGQEMVITPNHRLAKGLLLAVLLIGWAAGGFSFGSQVPFEGFKSVPVPLYVFAVLWLTAGALFVAACRFRKF